MTVVAMMVVATTAVEAKTAPKTLSASCYSKMKRCTYFCRKAKDHDACMIKCNATEIACRSKKS